MTDKPAVGHYAVHLDVGETVSNKTIVGIANLGNRIKELEKERDEARAERDQLRAKHAEEAGLWDEQHQRQHHVNMRLEKRLQLAEDVCRAADAVMLVTSIRPNTPEHRLQQALARWRAGGKP